MDKRIFSLFEVARSIQVTIAERYARTYWVRAEMIKLNYYRHSGHCYPDLVEKKGEKVIAQMRAHIWKEDYQRINAKFQSILKEPLRDGIKILMEASIQFHPEYGLSLRILDIDPAFTLGDLEREKQETIIRLQEAGLLNSNKSLPLPLLPQRIALISVETSKGYADFVKVLESAGKQWNYRFLHMLFPAQLQGDRAVEDIIRQLRRIRRVLHHFDLVAIVRGGGGDIGLSCYNHAALAFEVAAFPIPVLTGIGHATNETVVEMLAYENAITPTRLAEFLVQRFHDFAMPVDRAAEKIQEFTQRLLLEERAHNTALIKLFRSTAIQSLNRSSAILSWSSQQLARSASKFCHTQSQTIHWWQQAIAKDLSYRFQQEAKQLQLWSGRLPDLFKVVISRRQEELKQLDKQLSLLHPDQVLKRGYSISLLNGRAVTDAAQLKPEDLLESIFYKGRIVSRVESINNKEEHE